MQRYLIYIIIGICLTLTSCSLHRSDNGDIDGLWQATYKEDLRTGEVTDLRDFEATWGFQGALVQLNASTLPPQQIIGKFTLTDNSLLIHELYVFSHDKGDVPLEDVSALDIFGFSQLEETFQVLELNKNTLRIQSKRSILNFRKY